MEIKYQFFEEEKIFIQKFIGTFSIEAYGIFSRQLFIQPDLPEVSHVLIDFRDLNFNVIPSTFETDLDILTRLRKNLNKEFINKSNVRVVFWVSTPIPTVIAHNFKVRFENMDYNYCSTEANVMEIIALPESMKHINEICENLSFTYDPPGIIAFNKL